MKNKKIILGLGTITALGAMSVGFIACVKKKEIEDMNLSKLTKKEVEDLLKDVPTLTKEQVKGLLKNVSTLTETQVKTLIANLSKLTKEDVQEIIKDSINPKKTATNIFTLEAKAYLENKKENDNIRKNNDIGHFASGKKVEEVIKKINDILKNDKWIVVENATRDDIVGKNTGAVIEENGRILQDGENNIKFKLTKTHDDKQIGKIETYEELAFNFFVGKKDLTTITDKNLHHTAITKEKIVAQLNEKEEFKNINLKETDFEIVANTKKDPSKTETGKIKIKAKNESKKISGEIELILETVKQELKDTHLTGLVCTNNTTKDDIVKHINTKDGFKEDGNNITESDFDFAKDEATLDYKGKIKITPKGKTEGEAFTIDIPKLIDINTIITTTTLGELSDNEKATIKAKIKEKFTNIKEDSHLEITNITTTTAKVKGKIIYGGEVDVTFTIKTTTS